MSKYKKSAKKQAKSLGDVTINDFANSSSRNSRPKKSHTNVCTVIKQLESDKPWDEKDFSEDFDFVKEETADGTDSYVLKKVSKKKCEETELSERNSGRDYPLDIWFLLSEYIEPEDVGRFSSICKTSYAVANTAKFWLHLYKRYYNSVPNLPERLQPKCMFKLFGMRTSVVRSLFHMYTPFVNRFKTIKSVEHPDVLTKRLCMLMWHRKLKSQWVFYFKLKEISITEQQRESKPLSHPDLIQMLEDVSANSEENCRMLQITCLNFIPVPPVQGLFLTSTGITLSQGYRHNRVQLIFSPSIYYPKQIIDSSSVSIILDHAVSVKILDWWHPQYPHSNTMDLLLNQEISST